MSRIIRLSRAGTYCRMCANQVYSPICQTIHSTRCRWRVPISQAFMRGRRKGAFLLGSIGLVSELGNLAMKILCILVKPSAHLCPGGRKSSSSVRYNDQAVLLTRDLL